jgi:glycosyltransferase involved in cell wall biosynthesis
MDDGTWAAEFGICRTNLLIRDLAGECKITCHREIRIKAHAGGLADGRNRMVRGFLEDTDAEWLFMVDTDMLFPPDTVDRLLASADPEERPIMGGLCFGYSADGGPGRPSVIPTVYEYARVMKDDIEYYVGFVDNKDYERNAINRVAATGGACLLLHRTVMEDLRDTIGENWFSPLTHATGDGGRSRIYSEDFSFFVRCMQYGIVAHVDTSVKTGHYKGNVILDEEYYEDYSLRERNGNPE